MCIVTKMLGAWCGKWEADKMENAREIVSLYDRVVVKNLLLKKKKIVCSLNVIPVQF